MKQENPSERSFWLVATAVFALLVCVNYLPVFLGKIPFPRDMVLQFPTWEGFPQPEARQSYADIGDIVVAFYPFRSFAAEAIRAGTLPLWNPYILTGEPFLANSQSALFYPPNLLYYILPLPVAWTLCLMLRMFFAAFFMALLVRAIGGTRAGALLSAITFAFCGFMTAWQGQPMGDAAVWLPMLCYAVHRLHHDCSKRSVALVAVVFAMPVLAGHPETAAHLTLAGSAMMLFLWGFPANPKTRAFDLRFFICFGLGGLLSLGLAAFQMLPVLEWVGQLDRHLGMSWPALASDQMLGLVSRDAFRSPNSVGIRMPEGSAYLGMFSLLAASLAPFHREKRYVAFFAALTVAALGTAYTIAPMHWLAAQTPLLSALRNGRLILVAAFGLSSLAGLGVSAVQEQAATWVGRKRATAFAAVSVAFLISFFLVRLLQLMTEFRVEFLRRPSTSRALLLLGFGLILWKLAGGLRGRRFPALVCALVAFDLVSFSYGAIGFARPEEIFPPAPAFEFLQKANSSSQFRVAQAGMPYSPTASMMYRLDAADGNEILLRRPQIFTQDLRDETRDGISFLTQGVLESADRRFDMLNVKYLVLYAPGAESYTRSERFSQVFKQGSIAIYENKSVLPRAFVVPASGIEIDSDPVRQLSRLMNAEFDPERSVILSEPPPAWTPARPTPSSTAFKSHVEMMEGGTQEFAFRSVTSGTGVLVLSQSYYPGWKATVDGKPVPLFAANLALTGLALPAGTHDVRFMFQPGSFKVGVALSLLSTIILGGLVLAGSKAEERLSLKPLLERSPRVWAGARVVMLVAVAAIAAVNVFKLTDSLSSALDGGDEIKAYDRRLQQLRPFLPATGEIGYLADDPPGSAIANPAAVKRYYLAQYALSPLVVRHGVNSSFIVGSFASAESAARRTAGLVLVKDFGDNLMLLRRKDY